MNRKPFKKKIKSRSHPILDILKSRSPGSYSILVSRIKPDKRIQFIHILIDAWKMGLKGCIVRNSISRFEYKKLLSSFERNGIKLERISLNEAHWHIQYGLRIARAVGTHIPREFLKYDHILGDYKRVQVSGSLYKCFLCGKGELPEHIVEFIKKITREDMEEGLCGTEDETHIIFVCQSCEEEIAQYKFKNILKERFGIEMEEIEHVRE